MTNPAASPASVPVSDGSESARIAALPTDHAGRPTVCRVNRCGRPLGIGTHMSITGYGRASDQTVPVCEEHWQALRDIFPKEVESD